MSREDAEKNDRARLLYSNNRKLLNLLKQPIHEVGFDGTVSKLFGPHPDKATAAMIGRQAYIFAGLAKNRVTFLPTQWQIGFTQSAHPWTGCERWWAGFPLILLMELGVADNGLAGELKLNAEVGPISSHSLRRSVIDAIGQAAASDNLGRIRFQAGASDKGRLYSRFLTGSTIEITDIKDVGEVARKFVALIDDFGAEFKAVAGTIPKMIELNETVDQSH